MFSGNGAPDPVERVGALRKRAAHALRILDELNVGPDRSLLRELAEEMEQRAAEIERSGGERAMNLRKRADHARRISEELNVGSDRNLLRELAEEMERRAAEIRGSSV